MKQSKGEYLVDSDGNTILDLNAGQSGMVLGYNNDDMVIARMGLDYDRWTTHKVSTALPTHDFADLLNENVMTTAPKGLAQVHLGGGQTGAEANELAIATAMRHFAAAHNISDMSTICVAAFDNANHGSTTGTLSVSSPEVNSHGLPAFPWPKLAFPQL